MQAFSQAYEQYFEKGSCGSEARNELPRAAAYKALLSLKSKYHGDTRKPQDDEELPTSAPLFDRDELLANSEEIVHEWIKGHPEQAPSDSDVKQSTKQEAARIWTIWTGRDGNEPRSLSDPTDKRTQQRQGDGSVLLADTDQQQQQGQDVKQGQAAAQEQQGSRTSSSGAGASATAAAAAAAAAGGAGTAAAATTTSAKSGDISTGEPAPGDTGNQEKHNISVAEPQKDDKQGEEQHGDKHTKPKNTGGTKERVAEHEEVGKGGLTGEQLVGKIDLQHL